MVTLKQALEDLKKCDLVEIDNNGNIRQEFEPGGSTYPVILGAALAKSGKQFACVSGIDRQRFILNQKKNGFSKVVFHKYLETDQKEPVLVQFSSDEKVVYYNCSKGLGIVDCETYEFSEQNAENLSSSSEVNIYYDKKSFGSVFDLGVAYALHKPLVVLNDINLDNNDIIDNIIINWPYNNKIKKKIKEPK